MSYNFFVYLSRMRYISRWSLMRNTFSENIQEHSHQVAVLAHALALIRRDVLGLDADPERCATAALFHDASEILTGDLPTPIKYYDTGIRDAYRAVERTSCEKLLSMLPPALQDGVRAPLFESDETVRPIVKAADKLSAYIKCIEERKTGNDEFLSAEKQTRAILEKSELPELRYFLDHFIPAFELTLDELGTID